MKSIQQLRSRIAARDKRRGSEFVKAAYASMTEEDFEDLYQRLLKNAEAFDDSIEISEDDDELDPEYVKQQKQKIRATKVPAKWQSYSFMPNGFRIEVTSKKRSRHWQGGPPVHEGADCLLCKKPMQLILDIDCSDSVLPAWFRKRFATISRLPLYHCCRCSPPNLYQVVSKNKIETFRPEVASDYDPTSDTSEITPFEKIPKAFQRKPVSLRVKSNAVERILLEEALNGGKSLSNRQLDALSEFLGRDARSDPWRDFSQFGSEPDFWQGHEDKRCPNKNCIAHMPWLPDTKHERKFLMKELAVVCQDIGLNMKMNCAQIAFYICWVCSTIHSEYRCD